MKLTVFWALTPCYLLEISCSLHLQDARKLRQTSSQNISLISFYPEEGSSIFLLHIGKLITNYTAPDPQEMFIIIPTTVYRRPPCGVVQ
jgi:hypothetical protein